MSELQNIARERNWFKYFMVRNICSYTRYLQLSKETRIAIANVNAEIARIRKLVDEDWKAQRAKLKEE